MPEVPRKADLTILYLGVHHGRSSASEHAIRRGLTAAGVRSIPLNYRSSRATLVEQARTYGPRADAVLSQNGVGAVDTILEALRGNPLPVLFYATEAPSQSAAEHIRLMEGLDKQAAPFHTLAHSPVVEEAARRRLLSVEPFAHGYDASVYREMPFHTPDVDVVFVGSSTPRRRDFIAAIQRVAPRLTWRITEQHDPEEVCRLYHTGRVILHIHAETGVDYLPTRIFETLPCRPPVVMEGGGSSVWFPPTLPRETLGRFALDDAVHAADEIRNAISVEWFDHRRAMLQRSAAPKNTWGARAADIADRLRTLARGK